MSGCLLSECDKLFLISAWNDSGGAFTHRLFDGHPQLHSWPFELQLGTSEAFDSEIPWLKAKFRWPRFSSGLAPGDLFDSILDTELKEVLQRPRTGKFGDFFVGVRLDEWRDRFCLGLRPDATPRDIVQRYLKSFFELDEAVCRSGREVRVVGHCPNLVLDAGRVFADFCDARMLNVVRCPIAGFSDMRARNPDLRAEEFARRWSDVNGAVARSAAEHGSKVFNISLNSLLSNLRSGMDVICDWLELEFSDLLLKPTWRGRAVVFPGPFGGLRGISIESELAAVAKVSAFDKEVLVSLTRSVREELGFDVVGGNYIQHLL